MPLFRKRHTSVAGSPSNLPSPPPTEKKRFSVTEIANKVIPNFFEDTTTTSMASLHPLRKDMLYSHQLAASASAKTPSKTFSALDEHSFFVAGVIDNERTSRNVHKSLRKYDIIDETGRVDTRKISSRFIHQVPMLNTTRQRELVNMLFWWEEECQRFTKLIAEDGEFSDIIKEAEVILDSCGPNGTNEEGLDEIAQKQRLDQLRFGRERVRMKIRQRPSQRRDDTEKDIDDIVAAQYKAKVDGGALPSSSAGAATDSKQDERPPEYHKVGGI